ncbi:MAG: valine--tRNA ligase [Anaerolineaceae bacterium]|nr:valine--tRNA ligase [Anaerolineaceae bacterium]
MAMPKTFDFATAEERLYDWWERNGWFRPEVAPEDAEPFVISIPPPNVTGALHIGHALFVSIEDLMIRHARMQGKAALWVPGSDHAGIATQLQIERMFADEGRSKDDVGREEFLERTWAWKERYGGEILHQLRRMGASCDWERERFTLDDGLSGAVRDVFIALYEQGLIYRGPRLVNWSPGLQTAVSDLEVEHAEETGLMYLFRYPLRDGGHIPVATTRPETILGDTAVAVHPDDERYRHLAGRVALVPMLNREIPVIADPQVERDKGSGALKVTPGHDPNDFDIGDRHGLPVLNVMNRDASMNENAGPYAGLDRFACRERMWADMSAAGLAIKVEEIRHNVPRGQRGGEIIEPMVSVQWFLKVQPLAQRALEAVRDGRIRIVPERFTRVYYHWLENIEDWCLSRQLWWGHRIPAWYGPNGEIHVGAEAPTGEGWTAEEDVLDTWFSSGLWPFSTLGWPQQTADLQRYYPTTMMETGYDILFFWVARMIMLGLWFTDEVPFHTVYLHGMVRDGKGRKISKTLDNSIDPLEFMDRFGADPLRFTLVTSGTPGNDVNVDVKRIEGNWRFVNKLWQMASFVVQNLGEEENAWQHDSRPHDLYSRWILSRLDTLLRNTNRQFDGYLYGEAGRQIHDFLWHEFADWYIEVSKIALYDDDDLSRRRTLQTLVHVLETGLRLLHPFMPFVTEEIWQQLPHKGDTIMLAPWPREDPDLQDPDAEAIMDTLIELVRGVRNARSEYNVPHGRSITARLRPGFAGERVDELCAMFGQLCRVGSLTSLATEDPDPEGCATVVVSDSVVFLPLAELIDVEAERLRLVKERDQLQQRLQRSQGMLANDQFVARAPEAVVRRERDNLNELQASLEIVEARLASLGK